MKKCFSCQIHYHPFSGFGETLTNELVSGIWLWYTAFELTDVQGAARKETDSKFLRLDFFTVYLYVCSTMKK